MDITLEDLKAFDESYYDRVSEQWNRLCIAESDETNNTKAFQILVNKLNEPTTPIAIINHLEGDRGIDTAGDLFIPFVNANPNWDPFYGLLNSTKSTIIKKSNSFMGYSSVGYTTPILPNGSMFLFDKHKRVIAFYSAS